ncbi:MAG TPA: hypothetical protein DCZ92_04930 [Elusimicrobia bacterium]|nr:MAG: hypothetical protein A2016_07445 [Elusimicrobia bacterium GWF2_62_30]HBA60151.1 hypothetical protein [Elusimicrobiota bacterium]
MVFVGQSASAQDNTASWDEKELAARFPGYFTINPASVKITLKDIKDEEDMSYVKLQESPRDLTGVLVSVEKIINIAQKLWKIIDENKPVVNIDTKYATAYPMGVTSAGQLSSWKKPKTRTYGFYAENLFGSTMIDCDYKVSYTYGGAYKGVGKYLTGVTVIPTNIQVGWGYTFYMKASVPDSTVANVGTTEDPLASMQLVLNWTMKTILKEVDGTSVYYIQGDGLYEEIASPFSKKEEVKLEDMRSAAPLLNPEKVFGTSTF